MGKEFGRAAAAAAILNQMGNFTMCSSGRKHKPEEIWGNDTNYSSQ
jgi:hypothetical protein